MVAMPAIVHPLVTLRAGTPRPLRLTGVVTPDGVFSPGSTPP
jgi:hypothetical protein